MSSEIITLYGTSLAAWAEMSKAEKQEKLFYGFDVPEYFNERSL
jgi:hypothetical protein